MVAIRMRRLCAGAALAAVVAVGLAVHGLLPDSAVTDIAGDALYAVAIYAGLVVVFPSLGARVVATIAAVWCVAVELFQLTGVPLALGAAFPPAALVFGTGFDGRDLAVYVAAVIVTVAVDAVVTNTVVRRSAGIRPTDEELHPI